ncbi:hypothetical protein ACFU99_38075 [Streptomyces sp. NPDC057654]
MAAPEADDALTADVDDQRGSDLLARTQSQLCCNATRTASKRG